MNIRPDDILGGNYTQSHEIDHIMMVCILELKNIYIQTYSVATKAKFSWLYCKNDMMFRI